MLGQHRVAYAVTPREPGPRRGSRSWPALAVAVVLGLGLAASGIASPAHADTAQEIRDGQARLEQLNTAAEHAAERYNAGRIGLVKAQNRARVMQAAAAKLDASVSAIRSQAGVFAAQAYRSGTGMDMDLAVLTGTDGPATLLDRASFLDRISRRQADVLAQLATARHRQARAAAEAASALSEATSTLSALEADRQKVLLAARQAQEVLDALQAKQAELVRAAATAAARKAAEAQAAALASQAALNAASTTAFSAASTAPSTVTGPRTTYSGSAAQIAVRVAKDQLGKPYVYGAGGPDSFDCSGLTMYAYGKAGISLPHYTGDQWNAGRHVSQGELVSGDLVFFGQDLGHMGMYIGNGEFIHAPQSGDVVKISSLSGYYQQNYVGAVRVAG